MLIDSLAKMDRSSRKVVFAALIIIATIGMYNWVVAPHTTYLFAAQQHEFTMDEIAKKNAIVSSTIKLKRKKLQELRKQFAQLWSALFTPHEAKEFFNDLQAISEQAGCTVNSLNLITGQPGPKDKQSKDTSGIVANSAVLRVTGVYGNIIRLVEGLQARTQKVCIDSVKMESLSNDSAQLRCDIAIAIYIIQDKETTL